MIDNANHYVKQQAALREAYWASTSPDSQDFWPFSDALQPFVDSDEPNREQIKCLLMLIPDKVFGMAMTWGFNDTVVRDDLYNFVENHAERLEKALLALQVQTAKQDKSEIINCWSCKKSLSLDQRSEADGHCPHCSVEIELDD